jgi:hypothetical protein
MGGDQPGCDRPSSRALQATLLGGALGALVVLGFVVVFCWFEPPPNRTTLEASGEVKVERRTTLDVIREAPANLSWSSWIILGAFFVVCVYTGAKMARDRVRNKPPPPPAS